MIATIAVIAAIAEKRKKTSAIAAIIWNHSPAIAATIIAEIWKVLSQRSLSMRSLESGFHMISELFFSVIAVIIWKPGLIYRNNLPPFLFNCYLYALQTYLTHSSKLRLLLVLNLGGLHSTVTRPVYFLTWPIRVCASGQSIVRVQDLDRARHTRHKRAIIKKHLISANRNIHPTSFE